MKTTTLFVGLFAGAFTAGAAGPDLNARVEKSLTLMQSTGAQFVKKGGCISCHHQSIAQMAVGLAREKGINVNEDTSKYLVKFTSSVFQPHTENLVQAVNSVPASPIVSSYALLGLAAEKYPADAMTDAMVLDLTQKQRADGMWRGDGRRPPIGSGDEEATALSLRSLQLYGAPSQRSEFTGRISRAAKALAVRQPVTAHSMAFQALGLGWAGATKADIDRAVERMLKTQREDGGWAQLSTLESDAYATGLTLVALREGAKVPVSHPAYQRGLQYLLKTQAEDGSWHVQTRAMGFQPYFESGFPYGHDQWISSAATGWAAMALTYAIESKQQMAHR